MTISRVTGGQLDDSRREMSDSRREVSDSRREVSDSRREVSDGQGAVSDRQGAVSGRQGESRGGQGELWASLRLRTQARIGLGRAGSALPTRHRLELQAAHAAARDAVHSPFDPDAVAARLTGTSVVRVRSAAPDRLTYLQRPDLGRRLHPIDRAHLPTGEWDVVFVVADGLSSRAVHEHAAAMIRATTARLPSGIRVAPVVLAEQARVALGDDIAHAMGATAVVLLVGERPGMSAADSLGAYLTHRPVPGVTTDADRNCLSNIRPPLGLTYEVAAAKLAALLARARELGRTGVALKDESGDGPVAPVAGRPL